jgi:uncharacterized protein (TIGR00255 family)
MIRSMTGYGKADILTDNGKFTVEIRSVNHRYGEIAVKLPRFFLSLESELKKRVSERCKRGKIDVLVQYEPLTGVDNMPQVNLPLAKAYHEIFTDMNHRFGNYEPVSIALIAAQKDVLVMREAAVEIENVASHLFDTLSVAVANLDGMRCTEGRSLETEITTRVALLIGLVGDIASRAPQAVEVNRDRFRERLAKLLGETPVDEARFAQEAALLADRMDITEELVRLRSHFQQFDSVMHLDEPVGRKLDFLLQEMNREVNTIGSKANDGDITSLVVALKAELEKIREQVQNIE